jgi:carboxyl-terminal processing protease
MAKRIATTSRRRSLLFPTSIAVWAILATLTWTASVPAELAPAAMKARDRYVTKTITALLAQQHLSNRTLDDEISIRTFQTFLKQLDPMKVYFYQSDIDEFAANRTRLDDQIRSGDISFGYKVFNRFLQRLDERVALVPKLLAENHDFSIKEELVTDPDAATYPTTPEEAEDRWRKRIKYDLLSLKEEAAAAKEAAAKATPESDGTPKKVEEPRIDEDPIARLTRRYESYAKRMHQYNADDLLEIYLTAMTTSFDPHTTYMSPTTLENFNISMKLKLDGIGAALTLVDGYTVVNSIIPGGAADKQGELQPEDRIISVGQDDDGEFVDVIDMRLNDVVQLIRGTAGSVVRLLVKSGGETKTVRIVRDRIELKDSEAKGTIIEAPELDGGKKANGLAYRVGVIKLPSFYMDMTAARMGVANFKSTTRDVRRILDDFRRQGVDALILDLRFNGGGSLTEAIQLTGQSCRSRQMTACRNTPTPKAARHGTDHSSW